MSKAEGQLHVNPAAPPDPSFSLDEFRREMGALDTLSDPSSDFDDVGDEDDDVVVMRQRDFTDPQMSLLPDPAEDTMSHPDASRFLSAEARASADRDFIAHSKTPKPAARSSVEPPASRSEPPPHANAVPDAPPDELAWSSKAGCLAIMVALGLCIGVLILAMALRILT